MREQNNEFKKITQQYGSETVSVENFDAGLAVSGNFAIDGSVAGVDAVSIVTTTELVQGFGRQYSDGLREYYTVQDALIDEYLESGVGQVFLYRHDLFTNVFRTCISSDDDIMKKYLVRPKWVLCVGKATTPESSALPGTGYGTFYVTHNVMTDSTYTLSNNILIRSYGIDKWSLENTTPSNAQWGQAFYSDAFIQTSLSISSAADERAHNFDFIYEIEFKRIIE